MDKIEFPEVLILIICLLLIGFAAGFATRSLQTFNIIQRTTDNIITLNGYEYRILLEKIQPVPK